MELEEAKRVLNGCTRQELRDHAFGDKEVYWLKGTQEVACGYFGGGHAEVSIFKPAKDSTDFTGEDALTLRECGTVGEVERNDQTGPEQYAEGAKMAGLTLDSVRECEHGFPQGRDCPECANTRHTMLHMGELS